MPVRRGDDGRASVRVHARPTGAVGVTRGGWGRAESMAAVYVDVGAASARLRPHVGVHNLQRRAALPTIAGLKTSACAAARSRPRAR